MSELALKRYRTASIIMGLFVCIWTISLLSFRQSKNSEFNFDRRFVTELIVIGLSTIVFLLSTIVNVLAGISGPRTGCCIDCIFCVVLVVYFLDFVTYADSAFMYYYPMLFHLLFTAAYYGLRNQTLKLEKKVFAENNETLPLTTGYNSGMESCINS